MFTINPELSKMLDRLQESYMEKTGLPFQHFYCPVLFKDEEAELCQAHIVNRKFPGASRKCTVQRKDVDGFYGSNFEADFQEMGMAQDKSPIEIISDRTLAGRFNAKIFVGDRPVEHFFPKQAVPPHYTPVVIDGSFTQFGLKIHPQEFSTFDGKQGAIEFRKDVRVQMVASLIKAAHLTLFEMLGYQYALRAAGEFVGHQILGRFFLDNKGESKAVVAQNALDYFREFATMVRPLIQCGFEAQGTIADKTLFFCVGGSGAVWGMVVLVKTGKTIHGVLMPSFDTPEEAPTFFDFLKSENENIHIAACRFNVELDRWEVGKQTQPMVWPKKGILYPSTGEAEIG